LHISWKKLAKKLEGTNSIIILTADHGQINTPLEKTLMLKDHPKLLECLSNALSGEPRAAYCYVKQSKKNQFERYIKTKWGKICELHKSEDLVKKNYFGLYKPNPKLLDRIGDYVLILKDDYSIKDFLIGEKKTFHLGRHGGLSKEEMYVPLIVIRP
jgi:hypothetical protein